MDMTPLQASRWRGKFLRLTQSGTPSTIIYRRWSSRRYELGYHAPMIMMLRWQPHARAEQLGELGLPECDEALSGMGGASLTNEVPGVM